MGIVVVLAFAVVLDAYWQTYRVYADIKNVQPQLQSAKASLDRGRGSSGSRVLRGHLVGREGPPRSRVHELRVPVGGVAAGDGASDGGREVGCRRGERGRRLRPPTCAT